VMVDEMAGELYCPVLWDPVAQPVLECRHQSPPRIRGFVPG
jgi:hypothetical protein